MLTQRNEMAACALFNHPLSIDARVSSSSGLYLQRSATPQQLKASSPPTRVARSFSALPSATRSTVSNAVQEYLKSLNYMTRAIVLETETVEKEHRDSWISLDQSRREELVNEHFIPSQVRVQYTSGFVGGWQRMPRGHEVDNRPLHLSQPTGEEEWKSLFVEGHCCRDPEQLETLVSNPDLCLSQPLDYSFEPGSAVFTITSRLHKQQRSFRAANFKAVQRVPGELRPPSRTARSPSPLATQRTVASPRTPHTTPQHDRSRPLHLTPCASPVTLEDERESLSAPEERTETESPLGFQRNKLRSFSMRPKRSNTSRESAQPAHKSFRGITTRIKKGSPPKALNDGEDDKIDLPDESLLHDRLIASRVPSDSFVRHKPQRYSRTRLFRTSDADTGSVPTTVSSGTIDAATSSSAAKYTERSVDVIVTPTSPIKAFPVIRTSSAKSIVDTPSSPTKSISGMSVTSMPQGFRSSQDNLDTVSIASALSGRSQVHLLGEAACNYHPTMDPMNRQKLKVTDGASSLRPVSKRCGSSYKTSTSDFADRKALFKPHMLKKYKSAGSRSSSATPSTQENASTPDLHLNILSSSSFSDFLKPPFIPMIKHDSLLESIATDPPSSPDHMSSVSSPPDTPLIRGPSQCKRESGYVSSSFEVLEDEMSDKTLFAGEHIGHHEMGLFLGAMNIQCS